MSVIPMIQERRTRRSEQTYQAIEYQLDYVLKLNGLRNFTLSSPEGLILANAGFDEESEALAAYAPLLAKCTDRDRRDQNVTRLGEVIELDDEDIQVRSFVVDGEQYFLGAIGASNTQLDASIYRALTGIRRIFKQSFRAAA